MLILELGEEGEADVLLCVALVELLKVASGNALSIALQQSYMYKIHA